MLDEPPYMTPQSPKSLNPSSLTDDAQSRSDTNFAKSPFCNVHGFSAPKDLPAVSGPCALANVLHFYNIGWSHLPKSSNGCPDNDLFIKEIMRWSETPDTPEHMLDTSPEALIAALNKAGLQAEWYANGTDEDNLNFIRQELLNGHPVIVLTNPSHGAASAQQEWQVVFQMDAHSVYTKANQSKNHTWQWSKSDFGKLLNNSIPGCNRTLITAAK